jgi:AraC family transcriptional regulator, arabinose operon regulatory protein
MKILNYMNLSRHPVQCSFMVDRTHQFTEIYHAHQGMELLYIHEGSIRVIVNQQIYDLKPGNLVCFRPFQLHRILMKTECGASYVRSLFVFEPAELDRFLGAFPALQQFFQRLWKAPLQLQVFRKLPLDKTSARLKEYHRRIDAAPFPALLEEQILCLMDLLHHLRAHEEAPNPSCASVPGSLQVQGSLVAEQVMEYLEAHYSEPFELDAVAQAVHLTPNHVSAAFRQAVGTTITEYLTACRIRQSCLLLKSGSQSVEEIGRAVGLQNASYFCQLFKKHVGLSPHRFRRSFQKEITNGTL